MSYNLNMKKIETLKFKTCPVCKCSWYAGDIPKENRHLYSAPYKFSRLIAMYDLHGDRTFGYECPDCKSEWGRDTGILIKNGLDSSLTYSP